MSKLNLDQTAGQYAQKIIEAVDTSTEKKAKAGDNLLTKTLGVLREQGVYACILFLCSRSSDDKDIADKVRHYLFDLLKELPFGWSVPATSMSEALAYYANMVLDDLNRLLLVRELYEQTLIYARYGAKAAASEAKAKAQEQQPAGGGP